MLTIAIADNQCFYQFTGCKILSVVVASSFISTKVLVMSCVLVAGQGYVPSFWRPRPCLAQECWRFRPRVRQTLIRHVSLGAHICCGCVGLVSRCGLSR